MKLNYRGDTRDCHVSVERVKAACRLIRLSAGAARRCEDFAWFALHGAIWDQWGENATGELCLRTLITSVRFSDHGVLMKQDLNHASRAALANNFSRAADVSDHVFGIAGGHLIEISDRLLVTRS